jgi:hypothetical protein
MQHFFSINCTKNEKAFFIAGDTYAVTPVAAKL